MTRVPSPTLDARSAVREEAPGGLPPQVAVSPTGDISLDPEEAAAGTTQKTSDVVAETLRDLGTSLLDASRDEQLVAGNCRYARLLKVRALGTALPKPVTPTRYADTLLPPAAGALSRAKRAMPRAMYHARSVEPDVIDGYLARKRTLLGLRAPLAGAVQALDTAIHHIDACLDQSVREGYAAIKSALPFDPELAEALTDATTWATAAALKGAVTKGLKSKVRSQAEAAHAARPATAAPAVTVPTTTTTVQVPVHTGAPPATAALGPAPPPAPPRGARRRR